MEKRIIAMHLSITYMIVSLSLVTSKDSCPRNNELINCIQHQLRPLEDNGVKCNCNKEDETKIGFLATPSRPLKNIKMHATVIYDLVKTNIGGGYDPATGKFTAPSDGLYYFSWTTLTNPNGGFITSLQLNNDKGIIIGNHARASGIKDYLPSSQSAVVSMKKRDTVYIRNWAYGHYMSNFYSSFSGFKI
ncbi:complement C1q-like protein 3 [Mytilus californianus]|uniref:complement C1q-like protein 3 n=1 Tax=Mytilus californianus TaxID=6549 RepID=UPI00224852EA|nr:complement C1q-like protein 3 [Mytilus californianus]